MCSWIRNVVWHIVTKTVSVAVAGLKTAAKMNQNRRLTSTHLKREWQDTSGVVSSARTVRKRLDEAGLYGGVARLTPLLTERHKRV